MVAALLIGFCFGFFGSIPVAGPIAALVLERGLTGRYVSAALVGIGGGIAEAVYAFLAFYGFATYLTRYPIIEPISRTLAAVILIALGITFARYKVSEAKLEQKPVEAPARSLLVGFTITALNPTLIATWTAATTTLYSADIVQLESADALPFSLGALVGIIGWFALLTGLLKKYGKRFSPVRLALVVRSIGVLILLLGVWFGVKATLYFVGKA